MNKKLNNTIIDCIYGTFEVDDVILDLINSPTIKRLKDVHQGGATFLVNENWNVTRYDHSIGTMLLIKKLGGDIFQQISALLHDISHTAFSHVIDYILDKKNEDYHEKIFSDFLAKSDIPEILKKYNIDINYLINNDNYLLDADLPKLSVDRIDYTLRDLYYANIISNFEIKEFINSLTIVNKTICINSLKQCEWFTKTYYKEVIDFFMHPLNIYSNYKLTELLKEALTKDIISLEDFLCTDVFIIEKIKKSNDSNLISKLNSINANMKFETNNSNNIISKKFKARIIDPDVCFDSFTIHKSSTLSSYIRDLNVIAQEKFSRPIFIN